MAERIVDPLDYMTLVDGIVTWVSEAQAAALPRASRFSKPKRVPFGEPAGHGPGVHGRGRMVKCGWRFYLTGDIAAAIRDGYAWPWDTDSTGWADNRERIRPDRIHAAIRLDGSRLVWARDVRDGTYKAGSPITGAPVWRGREERVVQCDGVKFLYADMVTYLRDGKFPFDSGDGWD
jgi:hypothetical protein